MASYVMQETEEEVLRRAPDLDLIGQYQDSGFKNPPYMIRRPDGQVVQLPRELYLIVENSDGTRSTGEIATRVSQVMNRRLSADDVTYLTEKRLRPMGVILRADGTSPELKRNDPMLALNLRMAVVPAGAVQLITSVLRPLFMPLVVVAVLLSVAALDVWVFGMHGVAQSLRQLLYQPLNFLLVLALILVSAGFHECGHASACRYGGAKPGPLGAGVYIMWPVFYSDVTDAYRLNRAGRLRTDLGGVYFNCIFMLATAAVYFLTHYELLVFVILLQNLEIMRQFMPFLRLDGYYVVADVTGVPDIFARIKPTLKSLIPGQPTATSVAELKNWTRVVVTGWVVFTVGILIYFYGTLLAASPRILATTWTSLGMTVGRLENAWTHTQVLDVFVNALQLVLLVLPVGGLGYTFAMWAKRLAIAGWRRTEGNIRLRVAAVVIAAAAAILALLSLLPYQGRYEPIQPHEHGTVQETFGGIATLLTDTFSATPAGQTQVRNGETVIGGGSVGGFTIPFLGLPVPAIRLPALVAPAISVPKLVTTPTASTVTKAIPTPPLQVRPPATSVPTAVPSALPSLPPTAAPTAVPSATPSAAPSATAAPSGAPSPSP